ncbi:DnaB-like helicase C-terminal domain-containing protein [Bacteroides sp.]|uniref:replicative DNA helicase n=1 Tax=Bacteroides sp. TaxID=29523 RepID=UPI0025C1CF6D|nr:DnaB-like helicase C-terminal domain-containing protein [Bacteroides sp.]
MKNVNHYLSDKECELCVLGTLLVERNAIHQVRELLAPKSFYINFHEEIYCAILAMTDRGDRADIVSIMPELKKRNVEFTPFELASITQNHTFDLVQYACRLNELEKRRSLYELGQYLVSNGSNESEDIEEIVQSANDKLSSIFGGLENHVKTASDYMTEVYQRVNDNLNSISTPGTLTGFSAIDSKGGFQPTNLIICAAESSQGKTAFANAVTLSATKAGAKIAFYSMEMSGSQLMTRLAAIESSIPVSVLTNEKLTSEQLKNFDVSVASLSKLGIYFDDRSTSSIETILASIRSLVIKHQIQGVVIDYMQILTVNKKGGSTEESIAEAARRLKNIAKELNIWILALSQLSRDSTNPVPSVNRLRGSGQINEAADMTILLYRPEVYGKRYPEPFQSTNPKGTALIDIAKGRNVGVFKFIAAFDSTTTHFYELSERPILPFTENESDDNPF